MANKIVRLPGFIEFRDKFYSTEEAMKKIKGSFAKAKGPLTDEKIAKQTGLPIKVIKDIIKMLQKTKQLRILDPKKNPTETLAALGVFLIDHENQSKKPS